VFCPSLLPFIGGMKQTLDTQLKQYDQQKTDQGSQLNGRTSQ